MALLFVDPLLAWSVGFWLSVGATAGVVIGAVHLAPRLARLGPLALPAAVTLGAQCGVAVPSLLVFGRLSVTGTVANLVAVPVAGLVMLYGLPACLVAGVVPAVGVPVMAPVGWGVWWVDAVATVAGGRTGAAVVVGGRALAGHRPRPRANERGRACAVRRRARRPAVRRPLGTARRAAPTGWRTQLR